MLRKILLASLLLLPGLLYAAAPEAPRAVRLTCEDVAQPVGLTETPYLGWQTRASDGFIQGAYQIQVASSLEKLTAGQADVWESGRVTSRTQSYIPCGGALQSFSRYWWRVKVWSDDGREGSWSEPSRFVTGPLKRSFWRALSLKTTFPEVGMARKTFTLKEKPVEAYLFVAIGGEKSNAVNAYLNGQRVGGDWLRPGPLEYFTLGMRGYEVSDLLETENVINLDYVANASLVLQLYYADGREEQILSDGTWQLYNGTSPYTLGHTNHVMNHGKCETFDARLQPAAWYTPVCDTTGCKSAVPESSITWGPVYIRYQPLGTPIEQTLSPVAIEPLSRGRWLVDFGLNVSGFPEFTVHNCTDSVIVRTAEHITPEGEVDKVQYGSWAPPFVKYLPRGDQSETYRPRFMHNSYRYLVVEGLPYRPAPEDFRSFFIHSEVRKDTRFASSDEDLNFLYGCIERGFRANLVNLPTDCPGRERRGWSGDSFVVVEAQSIVCNAYPLYRQWMQSQQDAQRLSGWISVEFPMMTDGSIDLVWPMSIIINPWELYRQTGDLAVLERMHEAMTRYMDLLRAVSDDKELLDKTLFSYGDWCALDKAGKPFLGAVYYYHAAELMAKVEKLLGNSSKAAEYAALQQKIGASVNETYLHRNDAGRYYYDNGSQSSSVHALYFGICPPEREQAVFDYILEDIRAKEVHTCGFMGNTWIYPLLSRFGRNDLAYDLLTSKVPKKGNLLWTTHQWGATMLPENYEGNGSLSHAFFGGGPALWMFQGLGGITAEEAGYRTFAVKPYFPPRLDSLDIQTETAYGPIALSWKRKGTKIQVSLEVPPNTTGSLSLPDGSNAKGLKSGIHTFEFRP